MRSQITKTGQNRTTKATRLAKFNIPDAQRLRVIGLHIAGMSYRQIAEIEKIDKETVQRILHHSPELKNINDGILEACRMQVLNLAPEAVKAAGSLIRRGNPRMVAEVLRGTQVLTPRSEQAVTLRSAQDLFAGRTDKELEFFATHGYWPEDDPETKKPA